MLVKLVKLINKDGLGHGHGHGLVRGVSNRFGEYLANGRREMKMGMAGSL